MSKPKAHVGCLVGVCSRFEGSVSMRRASSLLTTLTIPFFSIFRECRSRRQFRPSSFFGGERGACGRLNTGTRRFDGFRPPPPAPHLALSTLDINRYKHKTQGRWPGCLPADLAAGSRTRTSPDSALLRCLAALPLPRFTRTRSDVGPSNLLEEPAGQSQWCRPPPSLPRGASPHSRRRR